MRSRLGLGMVAVLATSLGAAHAAPWGEAAANSLRHGQVGRLDVSDGGAIYSFPVNTYPDGWAALKAEPWIGSQRLTKVYDGTLFLVIGEVPGWKLVRFKSGEQGWIAERLVGCCRPASH